MNFFGQQSLSFFIFSSKFTNDKPGVHCFFRFSYRLSPKKPEAPKSSTAFKDWGLQVKHFKSKWNSPREFDGMIAWEVSERPFTLVFTNSHLSKFSCYRHFLQLHTMHWRLDVPSIRLDFLSQWLAFVFWALMSTWGVYVILYLVVVKSTQKLATHDTSLLTCKLFFEVLHSCAKHCL